ncbi:uncharacterized protein LOC106142991 [Amyelois transitella]|uniref:uncharacterized protein LOC106142991 n=1 Tax=Amyelois transitella TaxID=680683 RepID=UPI00067B2EFF|nr:uncharacterized protein LOC106142991 [Amyelois transitella]XP_060810698.1 uncharacterized protein LOC106142991 [Amyelois transitella]XP_060810702.1 uncharacterized protein LOC106142991 [Amyelois transitella]
MVAITITTFTNPFSFHCFIDNDNKNVSLTNNIESNDILCINKLNPEISNLQHGQYVAVMWQNKWARGIVSMEAQFLIWLIDYGIYLRPDCNTVYVDLPLDYKKLPTKVFEASIQGVTPVDKELSETCQIKNVTSRDWNKGAIDRAKELIASAKKVYFIPMAMLSTMHNDIILGDLYLQDSIKGTFNIIDELELWPIFLERNVETFVQNMPYHYSSRRRHRANLLKPHLANILLPTISLTISLEDYKKLCINLPCPDTASAVSTSQCNSDSEDGSTVIEYGGNYKKEKKLFKLTPTEIEKYCNMYVVVHGREYNVLNVLLNKTRDLNMCERYKDHDLKSIGRGITGRPSD